MRLYKDTLDMPSQKIILVILTLILLSIWAHTVRGAKVSGNIYTPYLDPAYSSIVIVNTTPPQEIVSKDATYSFELPEGEYLLKAYNKQEGETLLYSKTIKIGKDDSKGYTIDIVLFLATDDTLGDFFSDNDSLSLIASNEAEGSHLPLAPMIIMIILVIALLVFFILRRKNSPKERKPDEGEKGEGELVKFIRSEGGRVMQKEIRKHFAISEAKASLLISEFEEKGILRRIRRGRSNIIVLANKNGKEE